MSAHDDWLNTIQRYVCGYLVHRGNRVRRDVPAFRWILVVREDLVIQEQRVPEVQWVQLVRLVLENQQALDILEVRLLPWRL